MKCYRQVVPGYTLGVAKGHCGRPRILSCVLEPSKRALPEQATRPISTAADAAVFAQVIIGNLARETFIVMFLNNANCLISWDSFTHGEIASATVSPDVVARGAVLVGAVGVITAHNHPSGVVTPSSDDEHVWKQITQRCQCLGIRHLDNLVLGDMDYYASSLSQLQPLPEPVIKKRG